MSCPVSGHRSALDKAVKSLLFTLAYSHFLSFSSLPFLNTLSSRGLDTPTVASHTGLLHSAKSVLSGLYPLQSPLPDSSPTPIPSCCSAGCQLPHPLLPQ